MINFNQKELNLLNDLKSQEQICVEKYTRYENSASSPDLKNLMKQIGSKEQTHIDTINSIISGQVPNMSSGGTSQPLTAVKSNYSSSSGYENDKYLCTDALSTEKHVSSIYNTGIFEMRDVTVRDALNHIQKEEQEHGEKIFSYMSQNGMYS